MSCTDNPNVFLFIEILSGILFVVFAWFRTIITNRSERHIIFTDLEIYENGVFDIKFATKVFLCSAAITGVFIGLVFEFILPINLELELIFILFSFILPSCLAIVDPYSTRSVWPSVCAWILLSVGFCRRCAPGDPESHLQG